MSSDKPSEERRVNIETIKLLMQVAWADGSVGDEETAQILSHARRANFGDKAIALLEECLRGERKLPAPDLGFLRDHRGEALGAAEQLVCSDGEVTGDEQKTLDQLRALLGD
jgi:hypothetical protein